MSPKIAASVLVVAGLSLSPLAVMGGDPRKGDKPSGPADAHGDALPAGALARLGTARLRHAGGIFSIVVSPDGKTIATGGQGDIVFWDAANGYMMRCFGFGSHADKVVALAFDAAGKKFASAGLDKTLEFHDLAKRESVRLGEVAFPATSLSFTPDGKLLAVGDQSLSVTVFRTDGKKQLKRFEGLAKVATDYEAVAFSPDGKLLAAGQPDKSIQLWEVPSWKELRSFAGHKERPSSIAFSGDGATLASAAFDDTVRLWDVKTGKAQKEIGKVEGIRHVALSKDGKVVASRARDHSVKLWDAASGTELAKLEGQHTNGDAFAPFTGVAFLPDGKTIIAGEDAAVRLWEVESGKDLHRADGPEGDVLALAFSPDGKTLASTGSDLAIRLWDPAAATELRRIDGHFEAVGSIAFSPDGKLLASGSNDNTARIWETESGKEQRKFEGLLWCRAVSFSPDGKTLAGATKGRRLLLWDVESGKERREVGIEPACVAFAADGKLLVSDARGLRVLDASSGEERVQLDPTPFEHFAVSEDGKLVVGVVPGAPQVAIVNIASPRDSRRVPAPGVVSAALGPGGKLLAWGDKRGAVHVLSLATLKETKKLEGGHSHGVHAVAFAPSGKTLASAGADATIVLWDVSTLK